MTKEKARPKKAPVPPWWKKLTQSLAGGPQTREDLMAILVAAQEQKLVDADALVMIEGALSTSELQVRDIMVPRGQMAVIEQVWTLDKILPVMVEGDTITVNGTTMVVIGEIQTANATVYLVDSVMLPPSVTG